MRYFCLLVVFTTVCSLVATAQQCGQVKRSVFVRCFSANCQGGFQQPFIESCGVGPVQCFEFEDLSIPCCGIPTDELTSLGNCEISELKNPEVRSRTLELAKRVRLLIPTCQGIYVPAIAALKGA